jgi:hypothetical protein
VIKLRFISFPSKLVWQFITIMDKGRLISHPYCTTQCLRAILQSHNEQNDPHCPSAAAHNNSSFSLNAFHQELRLCLNDVDTRNTCILDLALSGHRGSMFKICHPVLNYCLIAKGFQRGDADSMRREEDVYARLSDLQGERIPLYCGSITLDYPLESPARAEPIEHLLLLSYGGTSILKRFPEGEPISLVYKAQILAATRILHERQVIHGDLEMRNVVVDPDSDRVILIDFERSRLYERRPPCDDSRHCRKTYHDKKGRRRKCMYCREFDMVQDSIERPDYSM